VHYVVTSVDVHGRIGDRTPLRRLGWEPGQPVSISLAGRAIVVGNEPGSPATVTRQGYLRLPASVRHTLRLQPGDRLLVASHFDAGKLVAYPTAVLDQMLLAYQSTNQPGAPE